MTRGNTTTSLIEMPDVREGPWCAYMDTKFSLFALAIYLCVASNIVVAANSSSACANLPTRTYDSEQLAGRFTKAVFKLSVKSKDGLRPIGTATLIDRRGYFVTASHVTQLEQPDSEQNQILKIQLVLENPGIPLTLEGREFARENYEKVDVSIIEAKFTSETIASLIPVVDISFNSPRIGQQVAMLGYELNETDIQYHEFRAIGRVIPQTRFLLVTGGAFNGQSGSLAIDKKGRGVGILHARDEQASNKILFTAMNATRSVLQKIKTPIKVSNLLDLLKQVALVPAVLSLLKSYDLSHYEAFHLRVALENNWDQFETGLTKHKSDLYYIFLCNGLNEDAFWFMEQLTKRNVKNIPTHVMVDAARNAWRIYALVKAGDTLIDPKTKQNTLLSANLFYRIAESNVPGITKNKTYLANFYYDYAVAAAELNGMKTRQGRAVVSKLLSQALKYNRNNWKTYTLAQQLFKKAGENELARLSHQIAITGYEALPPGLKVVKAKRPKYLRRKRTLITSEYGRALAKVARSIKKLSKIKKMVPDIF